MVGVVVVGRAALIPIGGDIRTHGVCRRHAIPYCLLHRSSIRRGPAAVGHHNRSIGGGEFISPTHSRLVVRRWRRLGGLVASACQAHVVSWSLDGRHHYCTLALAVG